MKILKSIGATIGYMAVYLLITILVSIAAILVFAFNAVLEAFKAGSSFHDYTGNLLQYVNETAMLLTFISGMLSLLCFLFIIKVSKEKIRDRLDLNPVSFKKLWPILPLGITLNILITYIINFLPIPERLLQQYAESSSFLSGGNPIFLILSVVVMAPILEEVLLRGLILKSLQRSMPIIVALIIQSVIFGFMHGQIIWITYAAVCGFIFGLLKLRYKSLYASILLHFSFNAASLILNPLMNSIQDKIIPVVFLFLLSAIITILLGRIIYKTTKNTINLASNESMDITTIS